MSSNGIIEQSLIAKDPKKKSEDGFIVTRHFIAVIDGSTSKATSRYSYFMSNGRYAMKIISRYIRKMPAARASLCRRFPIIEAAVRSAIIVVIVIAPAQQSRSSDYLGPGVIQIFSHPDLVPDFYRLIFLIIAFIRHGSSFYGHFNDTATGRNFLRIRRTQLVINPRFTTARNLNFNGTAGFNRTA